MECRLVYSTVPHSGELRGAGDCVREAVAVSSEGGAVEEGEVKAGEAVHGLPQEGGGPD